MRQYGEDIAAPVGNQPANRECQHDPNLLWSPSTRPTKLAEHQEYCRKNWNSQPDWWLNPCRNMLVLWYRASLNWFASLLPDPPYSKRSKKVNSAMVEMDRVLQNTLPDVLLTRLLPVKDWSDEKIQQELFGQLCGGRHVSARA